MTANSLNSLPTIPGKSKTGINTATSEIVIDKIVKPILNSNQYFHLLNWLKEKGAISDIEIEKAKTILREEPYSGI